MNLAQILAFINSILAPFITRFKASSPAVYAIIILFLSVLVYTINQGSLFGVWNLDATWQKVLEILSWAALALTGSKTYDFLPETVKKNK